MTFLFRLTTELTFSLRGRFYHYFIKVLLYKSLTAESKKQMAWSLAVKVLQQRINPRLPLNRRLAGLPE